MNTMAQLKPALIRLRMSGILERLEDRIKEAQDEKWAYTDFLLSLFRDEIERRDFKTLSLRLKRSELDPQKTLETFDFSFNARIHEPAVKELASCFFIAKHETVFLLGPRGGAARVRRHFPADGIALEMVGRRSRRRELRTPPEVARRRAAPHPRRFRPQ
jgi:hypothetical protein